ncbi:MAG: hypothetical protein PVF82_18740 [Gammaproteobacteria bacterium]|jgi:hypothetical protein
MKDYDFKDSDSYVQKITSLPKCFWALGAIYDLDVSITLDDLGWHFSNHYNWNLALETLKALKTINAPEEAEIFEETLKIVRKYWLDLGKVLNKNDREFPEWYEKSGLDNELLPLNRRMWKLNKKRSLLKILSVYVRNNPEAALSGYAA